MLTVLPPLGALTLWIEHVLQLTCRVHSIQLKCAARKVLLPMKTRTTIQSSTILEVVRGLHGHATAEEIFALVEKVNPRISRATVYRNLSKLSENGLIRKVEVPGEADRFERELIPHYHVKCVHCGRIFDVDLPYADHLDDQVRDTHGFILTGHDIVFTGICPGCQKIMAEEEGLDKAEPTA